MPPAPILEEPAAIFLAIIAVILIAPLLSERVRLPGIVGLIIGGVIIGRHGLNLLVTGPVITLFAEIGLIYLMFNAGLEIDVDRLGRQIKKPVVFASLSYIFPQLSGILIGRLIGLGWPAAILLGAVYASQTLLAYPIISRLGIIGNEAVSITMSATVFTDIASLLVLAVITGSQKGQISLVYIGTLVLLTVLYAGGILLGVPRLGRLFFRRFSGNVVEFQFVLVVLFVAAVLAHLIGIHTIVGAFLAGLAISATLSEDSRAVKNVLFMGESFFVPLFMVTVGMRLDPAAVVTNLRTLLIGLALTAAVYITKFLASWIVARLYDYSWPEMLTTWGLSQAQAAATLATILVGTQTGIFPEYIFDAAILMILFTSISSPLVVQHFGQQLQPPKEEEEERPLFQRILVPVTASEPPQHVLNFASLLARAGEGQVLVLNLATREKELKERREKLKASYLKQPNAEVELLDRIEDSPAKGILKEALESQASLLLLDWPQHQQAEGSLFDSLVDQVLWQARVPVAAAHLHASLDSLERLVFVVAARTVGVKLDPRAVELVRELAEGLDAPTLVLASSHYADDLQEAFATGQEDSRNQLQTLRGDYLQQVAEATNEHDLLVLTSMGSQARFAEGDNQLPARLLEEPGGSMLVVHVP